MKLYLKNCFLAFLCLYRSKSYGIRKRVVDHPQRNRAGEDSPPVPRWGRTDIRYSLKRVIANYLYPVDSCPAYVRLRGLTYLGANYPRTLNKILWLASLAITLRIMLDMLQESFLVASLRSAKVRMKRVFIRHSLRDGSRHVCMPSFIRPRRLKGFGLILILSYTACQAQGTGVQKEMTEAPVLIYGEWLDAESEEVEILLWDYFIETNTEHAKPDVYPLSLNNGGISQGLRSGRDKYFTFESASYSVPLTLTLKHGDRMLLKEFLVFPGDSIMIRIDDDNKRLLFAGPSADLFRCQYEIQLAEATSLFKQNPSILTPDPQKFIRNQNPIPFGRNIRAVARGEEELMLAVGAMEQIPPNYPPLKVLERCRESIPESGYGILHADIIGRHLYKPLFSYFHILALAKRSGNSAFEKEVLGYLPSLWNPDQEKGWADTGKLATDYIKYLTLYARIQAMAGEKETYQTVLDCIPEVWQDRVLAHYLITEKSDYSMEAGQLDILAGNMEDPFVKKAVRSFAGLSAGKKLFPFEFENTGGKSVHPDDFKGKWLFMDFWYTGCGGCVMFYRNSLSKLEEHFHGHPEFEIISVNTDAEKGRWLESLESGKYTSALSTNLYSGGKDHPFLKHYDIRAYPFQLIIDPKGRLYRTGNLNIPAEELISLVSGLLESGAEHHATDH